jgi:hypothetical protein
MDSVLNFLFPFVLPLALLIISVVMDSILKYGQSLPATEVALPKYGFKKFINHCNRFTHNFYFACIAFDFAFITELRQNISRHVLMIIALGILCHFLAYFHSYYIHSLCERGDGKTKPMTLLHFVYIPFSLLFLIFMRLYSDVG